MIKVSQGIPMVVHSGSILIVCQQERTADDDVMDASCVSLWYMDLFEDTETVSIF